MPGPSETIGKVVGKAKAAGSILTGEPGIFARLAQDHGEVWTLIARVASSSDVETRRALFPKIKQELLAHAKAEEQMFYPVAQQYQSTRALAQHATREHQEIERMLEDLSLLSMASPGWLEKFEDLKAMVNDHVQEEENEIFPTLNEEISKDQAKALEERFNEIKAAELARVV